MTASDQTAPRSGFLAAVVADSRRAMAPVRGHVAPADDPVGVMFEAPPRPFDTIGEDTPAAGGEPMTFDRKETDQRAARQRGGHVIGGNTALPSRVSGTADVEVSDQRQERSDSIGVGGGDDEAGSGMDVIGPELQADPDAGDGGSPNRPGPAAITRAASLQAGDSGRAIGREIDTRSTLVTAPNRSAPSAVGRLIAGDDSPPGPDRADHPLAKSAIDPRVQEQARPPLPRPRGRSVSSASPVSSPTIGKTDQRRPSTATIQDPLRTDQTATPASDVRSPARPLHGFPADSTRPAYSPTSSPAVHIGQLEIHIDAPKPSAHEPARAPVRLNGSSFASRIYLRKT